MMTTIRIATLSAVLLASAGAALAQQAIWVEVDDQVMVAPFEARADAVDDLDVSDAAGKKIGEIEEVIGPDRNTATALVVDFDDDAGLGDRDDVIVPIERFTLNGLTLTLDVDANTVGSFETYRD